MDLQDVCSNCGHVRIEHDINESGKEPVWEECFHKGCDCQEFE